MFGYLAVVALFLLAAEGQIGAIKALVILTFRSIINPGLAVALDNFGYIKWGAIFVLVGYVLVSAKIHRPLPRYQGYLIAFAVYAIISSFVTSSYPIVALLKMISYLVAFWVIMKGVGDSGGYDWIGYLLTWLVPLTLVSLAMMPFPVAYLRNGVALQGVYNHPNMFGLMLGITVAASLHKFADNGRLAYLILVVGCFVGGYFSASRTGVIAMAILVAMFAFSSIRGRSAVKAFAFVGVIMPVLVYATLFSGLANTILAFIYKGGQEDVLYSREGQIEQLVSQIVAHPFLGTGFMVPYVPGTVSYGVSFDYIVESGNLVLALLGGTGIVGTILFVAAYLRIFLDRDRQVPLVIFLAPFVLSMGEMAFFSTNNIAILYYVLIAYAYGHGAKNGAVALTHSGGGETNVSCERDRAGLSHREVSP